MRLIKEGFPNATTLITISFASRRFMRTLSGSTTSFGLNNLGSQLGKTSDETHRQYVFRANSRRTIYYVSAHDEPQRELYEPSQPLQRTEGIHRDNMSPLPSARARDTLTVFGWL